MSQDIPGFIKINAVAKEYSTSRKTVERRRDQAREAGESAVYRMFKLRTRDGEVFEQPALEQVKSLRSAGRVPEWFVSRRWLDKEFGKRHDESSPQPARQPEAKGGEGSDEAVVALREQYESTIQMLKDQLAAEKEEKRELLRYAQEDKTLFANVAAQLSRAVPALEAVNKEANQPIRGVAGTNDNTPNNRQPEPAPKRKQSAPSKATSRFWPRLFRSRRTSRQ